MAAKPVANIPYNTLMRYIYMHMEDMIGSVRPSRLSSEDRLRLADQSFKILEKQLGQHAIRLELEAEPWPFTDKASN